MRTVRLGIFIGAICFLVSALIAWMLDSVGLMDNYSDAPQGVGVIDFVSLVIISPIIETAIMALIAWMLKKFSIGKTAWIVLGLLMAALHSILEPIWGVVILVPFLIYAKIMTSERVIGAKPSRVVWIAHVTNNIFVLILLVAVIG